MQVPVKVTNMSQNMLASLAPFTHPWQMPWPWTLQWLEMSWCSKYERVMEEKRRAMNVKGRFTLLNNKRTQAEESSSHRGTHFGAQLWLLGPSWSKVCVLCRDIFTYATCLARSKRNAESIVEQ